MRVYVSYGISLSPQISISTIHSPACQEQVVEAAKLVANSVEGVVQISQVSIVLYYYYCCCCQ